MPDWLSWDFWANDSQSLNHLALIIAGVIGIPLLAIRTFAANRSARAALEQAKVAATQAKTATDRHEEQTRADRERRITESFAKAVEQLGSDKLETRLGGIYTLERIARESEREYWPIMETLFVRERAPWPPRQALANPFIQLQDGGGDQATGEDASVKRPKNEEQGSAQIRPATDIQAVLTILGRRDETARKRDEEAKRSLNLAATDLRGADFRKAHLEGADLTQAHLEGANLTQAHLQRTNLEGANLEGAQLWFANLEGAKLVGANLDEAELGWAYLEGSQFWELRVSKRLIDSEVVGARLRGASLFSATGITQTQLDSASGDDRTVLPKGLTRPAHWPSAATPATPATPDP